MKGTLVQVNVSGGGMPKLAVSGEVRVSVRGVEGDWQKNRKYHGGPDRAVCLFSVELYEWLRGDHGIDLFPGAVGENLTTSGIDLNRLAKGDRLRVGGCVIELTNVRVPCRQLRKWDGDLAELIVGRSGWVGKVLVEGVVRAGDGVEVVSRQ